jgi:hypothetical protein
VSEVAIHLPKLRAERGPEVDGHLAGHGERAGYRHQAQPPALERNLAILGRFVRTSTGALKANTKHMCKSCETLDQEMDGNGRKVRASVH